MSAQTQKSTPKLSTRTMGLLQIVVALGFAYIFGSFAIDSGSYWHYALMFISFGVAVNGLGQVRRK